ncbi:hypothetical protein FRC10_004065 [Ceratobasidium sp. 414]|nr:hypothetical protein FRC10_004065 [Ceratobasidium sp. 414]
MANMTESFTRGDDVGRALNDWKSWRAALAATVQGYLAACADLTTVCVSFSHQPHQRRGVETALLTLDAELTGLASEEAVLRNARASLTAARNLSMTLAPIHTLPPEILANIFLIVRHGSEDPPPAQLLAGISSYWRQVAINTPSLWTWINITTTQANFDYATLSLNRSNNCPIYLTIFQPEAPGCGYPGWSAKGTSTAFLIQASRQIRTLDIRSSEFRAEAINMIMKLWLSHGSVEAAKTLRVRVQSDIQLNLVLVGHAEEVLRSVSVLHLDGAAIPWASTVYHNLVDLRFWFSEHSEISLPVSQLATILTSSPGLVTLKISGLAVTPSNGWDSTTTVQLIHLEVLYLDVMSHETCGLLFPLIRLSACLNDLSIGIYLGTGLPNIAPVQNFLRDTPTRTQRGLSLFGVIPSLQNLVVGWCMLDNPNELRTTVLERRPAPCLPHLFIVMATVNLECLKIIVSRCGVQTIHLEECVPHDGMEELRGSLLEAFPDLVCIVSDVDTTSGESRYIWYLKRSSPGTYASRTYW